MKLIQQLIKLRLAINQRKARPIDEKLLEFLDKSPALDNASAEEYFYPSNKHSKSNFYRLKQRAITHLINHINASNVESPQPLKILSEVSKKAYVLRMMAAKGIRADFEALGDKAFKKALDNHLTDLALVICKEMFMHFSIIRIDTAKFHYYKKQYNHLLQTKNAEAKAEMFLFEVYNHLNLHKSIDESFRLQIGSYIQDLTGEFPNSYWYGYLRYNLNVIYHEASGNKNDLLLICQKAMDYFEGLDFDPPAYVFRSFTFRTVPLLILAGEFEAAKLAIAKTKANSKAGSHNWIAIHQYECLLGFHSKDYELCYSTIQEVKRYNVTRKESWLIYEAFLYLFTHLGKYDGGRFRLGKFLNEVPHYAKDKKGMNINIMIVQILVLLKDRRWPTIVDRIDALKAYSYRHLKNESTHRSDLFLGMLAVLAKEGFQRDAIEKRTERDWQELQESPMLSVDFEIVPYEQLWSFVLDLLL